MLRETSVVDPVAPQALALLLGLVSHVASIIENIDRSFRVIEALIQLRAMDLDVLDVVTGAR